MVVVFFDPLVSTHRDYPHPFFFRHVFPNPQECSYMDTFFLPFSVDPSVPQHHGSPPNPFFSIVWIYLFSERQDFPLCPPQQPCPPPIFDVDGFVRFCRSAFPFFFLFFFRGPGTPFFCGVRLFPHCHSLTIPPLDPFSFRAGQPSLCSFLLTMSGLRFAQGFPSCRVTG